MTPVLTSVLGALPDHDRKRFGWVLSLLASRTVAVGPAMAVATPIDPASSRMGESPSW